MPGRLGRGRVARSLAGGLALLVGVSGCAFGPKVLERSHGRYNESIRRVYEEQLLQNIVRIRYNEVPFRLNVSSVAAQYELAGGAEARPFFLAPNPSGPTFRTFTSVLPDVTASGANRPTITFLPASSDATRRMLTPISADTLAFLASTSWPVSMVIRLWVERLNGVPNAPTASGPQREFAPDFARFLRIAHLMQLAQDLELAVVTPVERDTEVAGPVPAASVTASVALDAAKNGLEYRPRGDGSTLALVRKERRLVLVLNPIAVDHPVIQELDDRLNLEPGRDRYPLVVASDVLDPLRAPSPPSPDVRLTLRSTVQILFYLANGVEVPPEHVALGLIRPAVGADGAPFDMRAVTAGLFAVHASKAHKPPTNAYVAVRYRGYWYYLDDRDQASKTTFALTLELSRLDFAAQETTAGPFLTLPIGR